jgi:hypothetical protein
MIVCGEGELIKTFLLPGQAPDGQEIQQGPAAWLNGFTRPTPDILPRLRTRAVSGMACSRAWHPTPRSG